MEKYYLKLMMVAVVAFVAMQVNAAPIDAVSAQSRAASFLKSKSRGKLMSPNASLQLSHIEKSAFDASQVDFYVFNSSDGAAYIILSGDDRAEEILGYGEGRLDMDHLPCNVKWWLGEYKKQMEWLFAQPDEQTLSTPMHSPVDGVTVAPMLTCKWSQMEPYYDQCPEDEDGRCVTGCVATAMAQVMYFWKYPQVLPALPGYVFDYYNVYYVELPPLPGTTLDWDNMIDVYQSGYSAEQGHAVATLMRYCGQGCFMEYSSQGSGSTDFNQLMAFKTFGYNPGARTLSRDNCDEDLWCSTLVGELQAGRPVPYTGGGDEGGHAFVIDGCQDGMFHVNWGWGGSYDGYFLLDAFKGHGFDFRFRQGMNCQVYPADENAQSLEAAYDFEVDGIYYLKNGDQATVTYKDEGMNSYSGIVNVPEQVEWEGKTYQVTAIGDFAFAYSPSLTAVRMPFIRKIGLQAFDGCGSLAELYFGKYLESLDMTTYHSCQQLKWIDVEDVNAWASLDFDYGNPLTFGVGLHCQGEPVTSLVLKGDGKIGSWNFATLKSLEHVTVEDGKTSIGDCAFYGCENLKTVTIGDGNEYVGVAAFYGSNLKSVEFTGKAGTIASSAFYGVSSLENLTLPVSLNSIDYAAFAYCDKIPKLVLHDVDSLGEYAFYGCTSVDEVSLLGTVKNVDAYAFSECNAVSRVNANDLTSWCAINFENAASNPLCFGHKLYVDNEEVTELVIPDGVESIGKNAFYGANGLTSVSLPTSVKSVGASAFQSCIGLNRVSTSNLSKWCGINFANDEANPLNLVHHLDVNGEEVTELVVPDDVETLGSYAFANCEGLTSVVAGSQLKALGEGVFHMCKNLVSVELGDNVKSIGEKAFGTCTGLKNVTFGRGLESIETKAFASCMVISDITCKAMTPPALANKNVFSSNIYKKATVTVPESALDAYSGDNIWNQFTHLVGGLQDYLRGDVNRDGEVNIGDINTLVDVLMSTNNGSGICDVNNDGEVNIGDINAVIDIIMVK